ncbi:hypothetical protein VDGL01_08284 [Verticillium dahliae]
MLGANGGVYGATMVTVMHRPTCATPSAAALATRIDPIFCIRRWLTRFRPSVSRRPAWDESQFTAYPAVLLPFP